MKEFGASDGSMAEFKEEVEMLEKILCDQIVDFHGLWLTPGHLCLALEYAPRHSGQDMINTRLGIPFNTLIGFLQSASRGLAYLDWNGALLDGKPEKVLAFWSLCRRGLLEALRLWEKPELHPIGERLVHKIWKSCSCL